jgi:RNA polymerase sporulation-specific sigma factor
VSLNAGDGTGGEETSTLADRIAAAKADTDPETLMLMKEVIDYLKANEGEIFSPLENRVWNEMLKGRNYREIALQLCLSAKTVDNTIQRIKKKVQNCLESE